MFSFDANNTDRIRQQLKELYNEQWFINGKCIKFEECRGKKDPCNYWLLFDRTVRLGNKYSMAYDSQPLRIVIMGKETLGFKNDVVRPALCSDFPNGFNRHYAVTLDTLRKMLDANKYLLSNDDVLSMYALSNLYSCAFCRYPGQTQGIPNTKLQRKNCVILKQAELKILKPTVLLIQTDIITANELYEDAETINVSFPDGHGCVKHSKENNCYIIESRHPSCHRHPWKET